MTQQEQDAEDSRQEADRILRPYVEGTLKRDDGVAHLRALYDDLNVGDRDKAKAYICKMFLRILARSTESPEGAVMRITTELCESEPFRDMLCGVVMNIIKENINMEAVV